MLWHRLGGSLSFFGLTAVGQPTYLGLFLAKRAVFTRAADPRRVSTDLPTACIGTIAVTCIRIARGICTSACDQSIDAASLSATLVTRRRGAHRQEMLQETEHS